eukprot:CAMPEP_0196745082 /NCGR_PEP_ID=MMETSP1091-20130531/60069_1 /TAXON_ID=302021 /ORGANISM="Rhodomonas sp., Strain CCMP768" /LENGTH=66 /DNA_ID=CAMNT_0042091763 /DNA_START=344 /DNA_END=541 /DNA_ORIENTATION=-
MRTYGSKLARSMFASLESFVIPSTLDDISRNVSSISTSRPTFSTRSSAERTCPIALSIGRHASGFI